MAESYSLKSFNGMIRSEHTVGYLSDVLGSRKDNFVANLTALVSNNIALQSCEHYSLMFAALKATALDLPLDSNLGFAYVIPYNDKKKGITVAQFQIGYKGFIQLAIRSGQFVKINVSCVKEDEIIGYDVISGDIKLKTCTTPEEFSGRIKKTTVGYLAYFKLLNGFEKSLYMSNEEIISHAKHYSKSYDYASSVYKTNPIEMHSKTVLKRLLSRWGVLSIGMQDAMKADQAVITDKGYEYLDNPDYAAQTESNSKANDLLSKALGVEQKLELEQVEA